MSITDKIAQFSADKIASRKGAPKVTPEQTLELDRLAKAVFEGAVKVTHLQQYLTADKEACKATFGRSSGWVVSEVRKRTEAFKKAQG